MFHPNHFPVPPPVLGCINKPQHNREADTHKRRHYDCDLGGDIIRSVFIPEGFRANNIAKRKTHQEDGVHGHFLRMAGEVGSHPRIQHGQSSADAVGHVVSYEFAFIGFPWEEGHEGTANNARNEEADDDDGTLVVAASAVSGANDADDRDGARGD